MRLFAVWLSFLSFRHKKGVFWLAGGGGGYIFKGTIIIYGAATPTRGKCVSVHVSRIVLIWRNA